MKLRDMPARVRQSRSTAGDAWLRRVLTRDRLRRAARQSGLAARLESDCEGCDDDKAAA